MNEWSPGGNYSRPGTPNQTSRTFRSQWEEPEKGIKPLVVNVKATADNRTKLSYPPSMEESKTSLITSSKNKKSGNGVSDPRFKSKESVQEENVLESQTSLIKNRLIQKSKNPTLFRVIPTGGAQNDACVGTEGIITKLPTNNPEKDTSKSKIPSWNAPELKPNNQWSDLPENKPSATSPTYTEPPGENANSQEPVNFDQSQDHLKAVDKLLFNHDIITKSYSKESLSNSTVNTRNTSLGSEDLADGFPNELSVFPSSTRVKKVQNWIQDQKKPERKQSVITVIGQTQGQDTLSSALREIDKRRKLVKELDKYAVCQKIVESDKEKDISDLVEKISSLTSSKKSGFEEDKPFGMNETLNKLTSLKSSHQEDNKTSKSHKIREASNNARNDIHVVLEGKIKNADASSDSLSPVPELRKRSSSRKKIRKSQLTTTECPTKGKFKELLVHIQCQWIFCVVVILSSALCWFMFFALQNGSYVSFDLFSQKPKKMTWYEKICDWIWELFRPSGNYRRTASWNSY